jgi:PAS domain S-box-containing protein
MTQADPGVLLACSTRLRPEPESAGAARRLLRDALNRTDRAEWTDSAELAMGEVVANAILHAHTAIEVTLEVRGELVHVEVRDFNPRLPAPNSPDAQATTGRGMALVAALSLECGVRTTGPDGKVVWFQVGGDPTEVPQADLLAAWATEADWEEPEPAEAADTVEVQLLAMPATLWGAAHQHHEALLRELVLYQAEHPELDVDVASADGARSVVINALRSMLATLPPIEGGHSLLPMVRNRTGSGIPAVDLRVRMPRSQSTDYTALRQALDIGEQLAVQGQLLIRPGLPEIIEVREWVCDQVVAQAAGEPPTPWLGTAQSHYEAINRRAQSAVPKWDTILVSESDRGVVAADDANRIVAISASLAAALGWDVDDLVGRRVATLIPPELREAHIAGFSRHLHTGQAHALGVPLELPVLHHDGTRVQCAFMVEQAPANAGRSVYVAWIEPLA